MEREWNLVGEWKRQLDVDADGGWDSNGKLDAGDCDSDRRWSDSNENGDDPSAAGGGTDDGTGRNFAIDDAFGYWPDQRERDTSGRAEADRREPFDQWVAGRSEGLIWSGKPVERGSLHRTHNSDGQLVGEDGQLERKRCGFHRQQWKSQCGSGVYCLAGVHLDVEMNQTSLK
jgi:hypothetical protein